MVAVELSKIVVVTINVIFLFFGLAALIVGIVFKVGWDDVRKAFVDVAKDVDFDLQTAGDALGYGGIIFGSFIIVVSLLGCIGACCKLRVLLVIYAIILLLLIIGECAIVGFVATHADQTEDSIAKAMNESLSGHYYENGTDPEGRSKSYSALFQKLECCGIRNYSTNFPTNADGTRNYGFIADPRRHAAGVTFEVIPIACCRDFDYGAVLNEDSFKSKEKCLNAATPSEDLAYTVGCLDKIIDTIKDKKAILIGVGVAILVLELLMVLLAFCLCCSSDEKGVHA